jgi:hypothetical protein
MTIRSFVTGLVFYLFSVFGSFAQQSSRANELGDIALNISADNKGVLIALNWIPELDSKAIRVDFQSIADTISKADVMRVMLQSVAKVSPLHPSLVVFARNGNERLLLDGAQVPRISNEYEHGNAIAAWRMLAEVAKKPNGEGIKLPEGLLARTTASFALVDEIVRESAANGLKAVSSSKEGSTLEKYRTADPWKPSADASHGPGIEDILLKVRVDEWALKDNNQIDSKQVARTLGSLKTAVLRLMTDARVALQQREQGAQVEPPPGFSELFGLQLKYFEIFPNKEDDFFFPLTEEVITMAPESTFAGLVAHDRKGKVVGRIVEKLMRWNEFQLRTDANRICIVCFVRWGEIKNKIAYDISDQKLEEDRRLELDALGR